MPRFAYSARDKEGQPLEGVAEAANRLELAARLRAQGLFLTGVSEVAAAVEAVNAGLGGFRREAGSGRGLAGAIGLLGLRRAAPGGKVKVSELAIFAREMATMLAAGVPIVGGLRAAILQMRNRSFRAAIAAVVGHIEAGESLSRALERHPAAFPRLFVRMVEAGELGGMLDEVFGSLAAHFDKEYAMERKIRGAMAYPILVLLVAVAVIVILLAFVLPSLLGMFSGLNIKLPLPTRILLGASKVASRWWWVLVVVGLAAWWGVSVARRSPRVREALDKVSLKAPVFGRLVTYRETTRFARTLATLLAAGLPILKAVEMVGRLSGNSVMAGVFRETERRVAEGAGLAEPLRASGLFPPMVIQMVAIGEEAGALDTVLGKVADYYDREIETIVSYLSSLIGPALILALGGIVGLMLASVLLPIFSMGQAF